jgi:hypothetical protein
MLRYSCSYRKYREPRIFVLNVLNIVAVKNISYDISIEYLIYVTFYTNVGLYT